LDKREKLTAEEIAVCRDAALLRALNTPHKRQKEMKLGKGPDDAELKRANEELESLSLRIGAHPGESCANLLDVIAENPESLIVIKWRRESAMRADKLRMVFEPSARFEELLAALRFRANELDVGVVGVL
jgi:hypothetical protein